MTLFLSLWVLEDWVRADPFSFGIFAILVVWLGSGTVTVLVMADYAKKTKSSPIFRKKWVRILAFFLPALLWVYLAARTFVNDVLLDGTDEKES